VRRAGVEELLGALPRGQDIRDLPVDAEVEVLLVVQALEEDVDRRTREVVGDQVLAVEWRGDELLLERLDLFGRGRDARRRRWRC